MIRNFLRTWLTRLDARADRREEQAALKLFPTTCRVIVTNGCPCGRDSVGRTGTVLGLSSFGVTTSPVDYRIQLDNPQHFRNGTPKSYELICKDALRRIES